MRHAAYETQYNPFIMTEARQDVSEMLNENKEEPYSVRNRLRSHQQELAAPHKKENDRDRQTHRQHPINSAAHVIYYLSFMQK